MTHAATAPRVLRAAFQTGVEFVNVIPDALNHGDPLTLPAPLQAGAMTWGWLYGIKFMKAELGATGTPAGDAEPGLGLLHVGSTGCANAADGGSDDFFSPPKVTCTIPNRNLVKLTGFDSGANIIVADIGAIFTATDLSVNNRSENTERSTGSPSPSLRSVDLLFFSGAGASRS